MTGLHPPAEPFAVHRLAVGDGHVLHVEECGRADGIPVIFLHGGPGSMCSARHRQLFDPQRYRAVLFDQRGCGRSSPAGEIAANTAAHLVADMERIRARLGIERWLVWGGSWGSLLALAYAAAYPAQVRALLLRGIFLGTDRELDAYLADFPERQQGEPARACIGRLHREFENGQLDTRAEIAGRWLGHEAARMGESPSNEKPDSAALAKTRIQLHYLANHAYPPETTLLGAASGNALPGVIVQGDGDPICPPQTARLLAKACPSLELREVASAGHGQFDSRIAAASLTALERLQVRPGNGGWARARQEGAGERAG